MGITFGVGTGITATIARAIGEENKEKADNAAKHEVNDEILWEIAISLFGLLTGKKVLSMLGSPTDLIEESWSYLRVTCYGMMFIVFQLFSVQYLLVKERHEISSNGRCYRNHFEYNTRSYFHIRFR